MSSRAWVFVLSVIGLGLATGVLLLTQPGDLLAYTLPFVFLVVAATLAQSFKAEAPTHQLYHISHVFFFAGVLLLPPPLIVPLVLVPHLAELIKERLEGSDYLRAWYLQPFNVANHLLSSGAALWWIIVVLQTTQGAYASGAAAVVTIVAAAAIYLLVNHGLVAVAIALGRGVGPRASGALDLENLVTDFVLHLLGYMTAALYTISPWMLIPALSPLLLIYRALLVPQLKQEAQIDGKTGLLNATAFMSYVKEEFNTAERQGRSFAILMADLDLLRNINNTYGHLAGDAVLSGIGQIIHRELRDGDLAGRFGGEEFAIVLPNVTAEHAVSVSERLRQAVERQEFFVSTSPSPIHATMSIGVACFPADGSNLTALIHEADVAVYQAKLQGRNCVVEASRIPQSYRLDAEVPPAEERVRGASSVAFTPRPSPRDGTAPPPAPPATPPQHRSRQAVTTSTFQSYLRVRDRLYIAVVCLVAMGVLLVGLAVTPTFDLKILIVLAALALITEYFHLDLFGNGSVSVSMAFSFAAALSGGIPGAAVVALAIVIADGMRRRPPLYRHLFNWSSHLLGSTMPVILLTPFSSPVNLEMLPLLVVPVILAALLYFLVESGLVAVAISLTQRQKLSRVWRSQFQWLAGYWVVLGLLGLFLIVAYNEIGVAGVTAVVLPIFMMRYSQMQYIDRTVLSVNELRRMNHELNLANSQISEASNSILQLNEGLFQTLAKIIDARDPLASGHVAQVSGYAAAIARELELGEERVTRVRQASFLHDIGKLAISDDILQKPGRLSADEYEEVKRHAELGAGFLQAAGGLSHLVPFVRHHHERWDGSGYPDGLAGEAIPLESRILAVCDAVEAMASDRPYQPAMSLTEILSEVREGSGSQFDPAVVDAFLSVVAREGPSLVVNSAKFVAARQGMPSTIARSGFGPAAQPRPVPSPSSTSPVK